MKRMIVMALAAAGLAFAAAAESRDDRAPMEPGKRTVGFFGGFNVDYIHAGQRGVTGMAQVVISQPMTFSWETYRKMGYTNETDFISMAQMWYRARYNDEVPKTLMGTDEWKVLYMVPTSHDVFSTYGEVEIPDHACDLEFFFVCTRRTPYYQYVDYTGLNIGVPGYTEEPPLLSTARVDRVSAEVLPSGGSEWFMRVRCGDSRLYSARVIP